MALTEAWDGLNRSQLASWLALSRPTVTALVDDLKRLGWAHETYEPLFRIHRDSEPSMGRPEGTIRLTEEAGYVGVICAGHTTLRVLLASNREVAGEARRMPNLDIDAAGPAALSAGLSLLNEILRREKVPASKLRAIAVGVPAPLDETTGRIAAPSFMRSWARAVIPETVKDLIPATLEIAPDRLEVFVENEANAMARGAQARGLAGDAKNFLLLKVSSGIGSGVVLGGRVYSGSTGGAAEFGHLPVCDSSEPRETCPRCLRHGCIETVASANAIVRRLRDISGMKYPPDIKPSDVIAHARSPVGHPDCQRVIVRAGELIGEVLANVVSYLDVERVLVTGVMAAADDLLVEPMRNVVYKNAIDFIRPEITALDRKSRAEVGLYGGAVLGLSQAKPLFLERLEED